MAQAYIALNEWGDSDLQVLGECPACRGKERSLMFSGLRDLAFATAPGEWKMWRCGACDAAYLDPRPAPSSIGKAYSRYYTHKAASKEVRKSLGRRFVSGLMNDYYNKTYGHHLPAVPLGAAISRLWPVRRRQADHSVRHLPAPKSTDSSLLDVGCGSGDFVKYAARLGFRAVGIDPDEKAITAAKCSGVNARVGTLPGTGFAPNTFEHITANHVLEHAHEPLQAIQELYELLEPGGRLWLTQPNLGALGLKEFGPFWRGLEPPRHLTLFDTEGMRRLLQRSQFVNVRLMPPQPVAAFYYRQSQCQASGVDPHREGDPPGWNAEMQQRVNNADVCAEADPRIAESLTMIAWKPQ
jgi:2-polyprenyl-3-methyl-5-hydroxy-6-metoxy-1,4-benzoquinol methylase